VNLYGYVGGNPVNGVDIEGLASFWRWPHNGNRIPGYTRQDNECSKPAQALNSNKCAKKCCQEHDKCYEKYGCNASSWLPGMLLGPCQICNIKVTQCILVNISGASCCDGDCCE